MGTHSIIFAEAKGQPVRGLIDRATMTRLWVLGADLPRSWRGLRLQVRGPWVATAAGA